MKKILGNWERIAWAAVGMVIAFWVMFLQSKDEPPKVAQEFQAGTSISANPAKEKMKDPDIYFQCGLDGLPAAVCRAFGQGELPSTEYMRTNPHYDECLARGGAPSQCDAAMRVLYRDIRKTVSEQAAEKSKKLTEDCLAASKDANQNPFDCFFDPDKVGASPASTSTPSTKGKS